MRKRTGLFVLCFILFSVIYAQGGAGSMQMAKPDLQGHRGARGLMPENTIPAMLKAIDLGVTTLELDVVISRDKKVVVSHDPFFHEAITTTPKGDFLTKEEAERHLIYAMSYDSIRRYDVGLKPHPGFPLQEKIAVCKPLLSDLIDSCEAYALRKKKKLLYNIEIKSVAAYDGKRHPLVPEFVTLVMTVIKKKGIEKRTVIQSFDVRALRYMHQQYPKMPLSFLVEDEKASLIMQLNLLGFIPQIYSPRYTLVDDALIEAVHANGMKIIPWTVNDVTRMKLLLYKGVDGIISDYPDLFAAITQ